MLPFKGKTSGIRQYCANKPKKWGYKLWMLADAFGYSYKAVVYEGAKYENGVKIRTKKLGETVVLDLLTNYYSKGHIVITDNFYTTIDLAKKLLDKGTFIVGQIKQNANGLDKEWIKNTKKELKEKGDWDWRMKEGIASFLWNDTKINLMIGTWIGLYSEDGEFNSTIERNNRREIIQRNCPSSANIYNENMGGVDLNGSHRARYSSNLTSRKWYHPLLYGALDIAIINAWINWKEFKNEEISLFDFKKQLILCMAPDPKWWLKRKTVSTVNTPVPKKSNSHVINLFIKKLKIEKSQEKIV